METNGTLWSVILPISWSRVFWNFLVSKGAPVIGMKKRWIAGEIGLPYFPSDFPDCHSYLSLNEIEAIASRENAERRPPAVRPFRIPIPSPWNAVHAAFDKLTMRVNKAAQVSSGENIVGTSSCESDVTSFRSHNSFDGIVARTSSVLTDFLNDIGGEHLLLFPQLQNNTRVLLRL
ncbi:ribonucleases P/MRP protein subunit POP1-like [Hibiscus syriacus]|uniref:ribonucleases P/MRP protein subunit POP1-like n=1 Tax=Hibiscus syriacus TaxID=106335 RepID=UPI00192390C5|nr:ribonucleases P/MRP protein subunit POP1-like [Hibiscus syriacus]